MTHASQLELGNLQAGVLGDLFGESACETDYQRGQLMCVF
jgi:hypothetical protein